MYLFGGPRGHRALPVQERMQTGPVQAREIPVGAAMNCSTRAS